MVVAGVVEEEGKRYYHHDCLYLPDGPVVVPIYTTDVTARATDYATCLTSPFLSHKHIYGTCCFLFFFFIIESLVLFIYFY